MSVRRTELPDSYAPVGLIAGAGRFPVVFARKAKELRIPVCCAAIKNLAPAELRDLSAEHFPVGLARIGRVIRGFRRAGVRRIVMAGKIHKTALVSPWRILELLPDWTTIRFWYSQQRRDNRDDSLLLGVIGEFERRGFTVTSALDICPEILVRNGVLTRRGPSAGEEKDIAFGWDLAKQMGGLDVGQSVAVREQAVLAVEAIEGTDLAITRAGELCRRASFVVVKVAKPQQDMRFDVPTVGRSTIETMHNAGGRVLAIEAGKTIILEEDETIALADRLGICVIAIDQAAVGSRAEFGGRS